jgi:uncharacterized protein YllA (UPF0747 family)
VNGAAVRVEREATADAAVAPPSSPPAAPARVPAALAEAIAARQTALGAGARSVENARALGREGALCVVAGQQPGLFGGALLAFHKAAGAVRLARTLAERWRRPVVPLFWSASDDHDVDEVRFAWVMDAEGQPRRVAVDVAGRGESVRHVALDAKAAAAACEDLAEALPRTDRAREAVALAARPEGADLATWSQACLLRVFGDAGLVVLEPGDLAPFSGALLATLAERGFEVTAAVRAAPGPLRPDADDAPLFVREVERGPRVRLRRTDDVAAVAARVRSDPRLASGDVVGRVLHQDALLPVAAFLVGPTEGDYVLQTAEAHRLLGIPFPPVLARPSATWVDGRSARIAEAFGVRIADVLAGAPQPALGDEAVARGLAAQGDAVRALRERAADLLARGGEGAAALRRALDRLEEEWTRASGAVREGFARDEGVGRARWARLQAALLPRGRPQERSISPLSLVARHGLDAVRAGLDALDPCLPGHAVIHL